jgi:hypothetical protein
MASKKSTGVILTAKQLRYAAENKIPVFYTEQHENPHDRHMNYKKACVMEPASSGYYIGDSDIDPDDYAEDDLIQGELDDGFFNVTGVVGQKYEPKKL